MNLSTRTASSRAAAPFSVPAGVVVEPRRFDFRDLDAIPKYWFADNAIITHMENAFSFLIPPGEAFFIRSVRNYQDRAKDPAQKALIEAFVQQEGLHTRAHNEFNASLARFGVDVARETAYARRTVARMEKFLPKKMRLGVTVFLEHLTAVGAHTVFSEPVVAESMHPEALRFWRWHAAEELEHKAVAFDLFREVGGGYWLRVLSAVAAIALLAVPLNRLVVRMSREDPQPVSEDMRKSARELNRKIAGPQLRMIGKYFRPGFHPWNENDEPYLRGWYRNPDVSAAG
ncbi:MAG: metal-dependent hydrolase [bacterium]|nr:metal-dependent hydrolase [bacterium]